MGPVIIHYIKVQIQFDLIARNKAVGAVLVADPSTGALTATKSGFGFGEDNWLGLVPTVGPGEMYGYFNPVVASDGSGFLVAWNRKLATYLPATEEWQVTSTIWMRRFDADGVAQGASEQRYDRGRFPRRCPPPTSPPMAILTGTRPLLIRRPTSSPV